MKKESGRETLIQDHIQKEVERVQKDLFNLQNQPGFARLNEEQKKMLEWRSGPGWTATQKATWVSESRVIIALLEDAIRRV